MLKTPATHAAVYWPTLWPTTTSGWMPHDCHNLASAISTAKSAGSSKGSVAQRLFTIRASVEHHLQQGPREHSGDDVGAPLDRLAEDWFAVEQRLRHSRN